MPQEQEQSRERIIFRSRVKNLEKKSRIKCGYTADDTTYFEKEDLGWAILLEGNWEWWFIGNEEPTDLKPGDFVEVTIEKLNHVARERPVGDERSKSSEITQR